MVRGLWIERRRCCGGPGGRGRVARVGDGDQLELVFHPRSLQPSVGLCKPVGPSAWNTFQMLGPFLYSLIFQPPPTTPQLRWPLLRQVFADTNLQNSSWASLVVQWLRIRPLMQRTWGRFLLREDPASHRTTNPMCCKY